MLGASLAALAYQFIRDEPTRTTAVAAAAEAERDQAREQELV
jgi:hypothetical protein